jgi:flagellar assembly protein FliH
VSDAFTQPYVLEPLQAAPVGAPEVGDLLAVVDAARAEADAIREQARAEGLAQGRAEGAAAALEEARAHTTPAVQALAAAVEALVAGRAEAADRVEVRAVDLAFELAEKIVGGAVAVQPERVLDAVRGGLRCLVERERVQVLVHPDDLALVRESMDGMGAELGGIEHVEVMEERRIARGGALVRTPEAEIDAAVRTKLERAREVVMAELGAA